MFLMNYEGGRAKHNYPVSFLTSQEQLSAICSTSQICPFLSTRALAPWIMASLFRSPPWQQFPKWFPRCLSGLLKFTFHTVTKVIFPKSESGSDTIPFLKSFSSFLLAQEKRQFKLSSVTSRSFYDFTHDFLIPLSHTGNSKPTHSEALSVPRKSHTFLTLEPLHLLFLLSGHLFTLLSLLCEHVKVLASVLFSLLYTHELSHVLPASRTKTREAWSTWVGTHSTQVRRSSSMLPWQRALSCSRIHTCSRVGINECAPSLA